MTELAAALGGLGVWVRLHYVYPYPHVDEVIPLMADGKILPYLDVPFQHASPRILKAMKRPASSENNLARIRRWREICPDLTIRSTFIVGFPGETAAEFEQLLEFIEDAQLDRVGCFTYSAVDGAAANALPGHVPEEIKEERKARFMATQATISTARLKRKIGKTLTVLIDEASVHGRHRPQQRRRAGNRRRGARRGARLAQGRRVRARKNHGFRRTRPARCGGDLMWERLKALGACHWKATGLRCGSAAGTRACRCCRRFSRCWWSATF